MRTLQALALSVGPSLACPSAVYAHPFEVRYNLPVPLWLYLIGAGLTVAASFMVLLVTQSAAQPSRRARSLPAPPLLHLLIHPIVLHAPELVAVAVLALVLVAGFSGPLFPAVNFASVFVWVVWWVGMAFVVALVGNVWTHANPWRAAYPWAEVLAGRLSVQALLSGGLELPAVLASWPAAALLLVFVWLELVFPHREDPRTLAWLVSGYSVLTWLGMWLFGRETWLARGEVFTRVFDLFGRFAPVHRAPEPGREVRFRGYAVGLAEAPPADASETAFVLALLASLTFDGFSATPL